MERWKQRRADRRLVRTWETGGAGGIPLWRLHLLAIQEDPLWNRADMERYLAAKERLEVTG